jgi:Arc/MetJ family transcription regulator
MATNLNIDDKLVVQAQKAGRHRTKREAVTAALQEYITHRKQLEILDLFGTVEFDPAYDHKKERQRDSARHR